MIDVPPLPNESLRTFTLKDGRSLAYMEYGNPTGTPILFFHGTPGSHYLIKLAERGALTHGFRVIAPDRPGMGHSTHQDGRELYHYPLDIVQLMEHLGLKKAAILAISGGAPYAFQCANDLAERICFVGSLSGWVSYGRPGMKEIPIERMFRFIGWATEHAPFMMTWVGKSAHHTVQHRIQHLYKHMLSKLPKSDIAMLQDDHVRTIFLSDLQNAFRQGWKGAAKEASLQFSKPAYEFSEITQPVLLMHGTADSVVPYAFAEYMNARLPNVIDFMTIEDGGHLCAVSEQDNIFAKVREYLPTD